VDLRDLNDLCETLVVLLCECATVAGILPLPPALNLYGRFNVASLTFRNRGLPEMLEGRQCGEVQFLSKKLLSVRESLPDKSD
jgi:hypothetical protein